MDIFVCPTQLIEETFDLLYSSLAFSVDQIFSIYIASFQFQYSIACAYRSLYCLWGGRRQRGNLDGIRTNIRRWEGFTITSGEGNKYRSCLFSCFHLVGQKTTPLAFFCPKATLTLCLCGGLCVFRRHDTSDNPAENRNRKRNERRKGRATHEKLHTKTPFK